MKRIKTLLALTLTLLSLTPAFAAAEETEVRLWPDTSPTYHGNPNPYWRHWGGNIVEETHPFTIGGRCTEGYIRSDEKTTAYITSGHGWCRFDGWASEDPEDCTAKFISKTNAFWGSNWCYAAVFEKRNPSSCGRHGEYCGDEGSAGGCYCDPECKTYGDCCFDYTERCTRH